MKPSLKTLKNAFDVEVAEAIHRVLRDKVSPESYKSVENWVARCYHKPSDDELKMAAINEILEGFGVEALFSHRSLTEPEFEYINLGDTYITTIVRNRSGNYYVTSWGDMVESLERRGIKFD